MVTFNVRFNIAKGGHAFAVIGYKKNISKNEFLIEILNPWHSGDYLENNIKKNNDYNNLDNKLKYLFDEQKKGENISEEEFNEPELKEAFDNYEKNGYLIMKFNTFFKWFTRVDLCDPMIGSEEFIIELFPKEKRDITFNITEQIKFKSFLICNKEKLNEEQQIVELNKKISAGNKKYKLILKNIRNNYKYENEDDNTLIYEILERGNYSLEIINNGINEIEEDDYIYIKIQTDRSINLNFNGSIKYNTFSKLYGTNQFDLSNGGIGLSRCTHKLSDSLIDNNNHPPFPPRMCACQLFERYLLIDEIMFQIIQLCTYFSINRKYDFSDILPKEGLIYRYVSSIYVKNPHLYYHYIEKEKGFIVIIINKSKFNWDCNSRIEYIISSNEFYAYFSYGSFKINYNLKIYDFDINFKNILTSFNYTESFLYLRDSITIIENLKLNDQNRIFYFEKIVSNLELSKINFININGSSCYQSSILQGFIHVVFPIAIRNIILNIKNKRYKNIYNIDQLKNYNEYNNMLIDIIKDINNLQEKGEGATGYKADKLFSKFPPKKEFHEGIGNIFDINIMNDNLQNNAINPSNFISNLTIAYGSLFNFGNLIDDGLIKEIIIKQNTIISEVMKLKIEGDNNFYGNLVLKIDDNDIKDDDLNLIKLLKKCPQLNINNSSNKKIELVSDIVYIVIDRISNEKSISKEFNINEKIYFDKINGVFSSDKSSQFIIYELRFLIYHKSYGHYVAYVKIQEDWYIFNDLNFNYANKFIPPLKDDKKGDIYPVALYYVKCE